MSLQGVFLTSSDLPEDNYGDLDCHSVDSVPISTLRQAEFFVLAPQVDPRCWKVLERIRRAPDPGIYLKPVVVTPAAEDFFKEAVDLEAPLDPASWPVHVEHRVSEILRRINQIVLDYNAPDTSILLRSLRLIASRDVDFVPTMTTRNPSGFVYPPLEPLLGDHKESGIELFDILEQQRLVQGRLVTKTHRCSHCGCAFLNFQETCPHCDSLDITLEELVHHFRCGYVAPLNDYRQDDRLLCPKCDTDLQHIGVDYDKPSTIFRCHHCYEQFQDGRVLSTCFACRRTTRPEYQTHQRVNAYTVTALGRNAATNGLDSLFTNVLEKELNLWPWPSFKELVEMEKARIERYRFSVSSLLVLKVGSLDTMHVQLGRRAHEVFRELASAVQSLLRRPDAVSIRHQGMLLILLTETSLKNAEGGAARVKGNITQLLEASLESAPTVRTEIYSVVDITSLDELVKSIEQQDVAG